MVLRVEYILAVLFAGVTFSFFTACDENYGADGKKVYEGECRICHGDEGKRGTSGAADLSTSRMSLEDRIDIITNGSDNDQMLPFKGTLSKEQIEAVAKYIEELRK